MGSSEQGQPSAEIDVELAGVSRHYGEVRAVDDLSLTIRRGEFFALLGSSGCGKSTTLRMIGGLETATSGELFIGGQRVNDVPAHRRATNMVFQHLGLFPHLTVFENVAFGLRLKRMPGAAIAGRVAEYLGLVSLAGFEQRYPDQLSGGQQQRVAIARALVNQPRVLLLDEPLGALDLKLRTQMQSELKALQRRLQTTFIYVTHDQSEAFAMSDRIAVMNAGRIEQIGAPAEVYRSPANQFVAGFVGDTNFLDAEIIGQEGDDLIVDAGGLTLRVAGNVPRRDGRLLLSIRPEHVQLARPGSPQQAQTAGAVQALVFQGSFIHLTIATDSGPVLISKAIEGSEASELRVGDRVQIGWRADALKVLS
ncbi:MAG: ABC transporter ATP-binding protein [Betaproteobacteria bacterium]